MQALLTDITVESKQSFDIQNFQSLKQSQTSKSSISFSELLESTKKEEASNSEIKSETKPDAVKQKESEKNETKSEKNNDVSEKKADSVEEKKSEKESEKKVDDKSEVKNENAGKETVEKKQNLDSLDIKDTKSSKKEELSKKEKKEIKVASKKEQILDKKEKVEKKQNSDLTKKIESDKKTEKNPKFSEKNEDKIIAKSEYFRIEELAEKDLSEEEIEDLSSYVAIENAVNNESTVKNDIQPQNNDEEIKEIDFSDNKVSEKISYLDEKEKIVVKDQRTEIIEEDTVEKKGENFKTEVKFDNENTATITMEVNTQNSEANVLSLNNQVASSDGSNFQAMLNNQIQSNIPEFVKAGTIVLKDNNQGSINLILHPDDIGNVKISLSLDGKSISGHIIVNTKEAMEVFKDNAQDLREAFIKNGFDAANFDVSYNNNNGNNQNNDFNQQFNTNEFIAKKIYYNGNSSDESDLRTLSQIDEKNSEYFINIVA